MIEELARIPVEVDYSSEFRYRNPIIDDEHAGDRHHASPARPPTRWRRCEEAKARGGRTSGHLQRGGQLDARGRPTASSTPTPARRSAWPPPRPSRPSWPPSTCFALYLGRQRGTLDAERVRDAPGGPRARCPQLIETVLRPGRGARALAPALLRQDRLPLPGRGASTTPSRWRGRSS